MYQIKEQVKTSETDLNEMEISDLLNRSFKTRATEAKRTVQQDSEYKLKSHPGVSRPPDVHHIQTEQLDNLTTSLFSPEHGPPGRFRQ